MPNTLQLSMLQVWYPDRPRAGRSGTSSTQPLWKTWRDGLLTRLIPGIADCSDSATRWSEAQQNRDGSTQIHAPTCSFCGEQGRVARGDVLGCNSDTLEQSEVLANGRMRPGKHLAQ